jgi:hypothetical protein
LLLKRFGPAMMDSLNFYEFVNLVETLEYAKQHASHYEGLPRTR